MPTGPTTSQFSDIPDIAVGDHNAAARKSAWEDELVARYEQGLPLTNADRKEARRVIAQRKSA